MVLLCASLAMQAVTHTVGRGETLASIAERYHVTVEQLVAANPGADRLFYVGLKLEIPEAEQAEVTSPAIDSPQNVDVDATKLSDQSGAAQTQTVQNATDRGPGFVPAMIIQYGFIPKTVKGENNYTFSANAGGNYYITDRERGLFAGVRIGYSNSQFSLYSYSRGNSVSSERSSHFITLPINIGYSFATSDKRFAIIPLVAFVPNFCVSSIMKTESNVNGHKNSNKQKFKKKTGIIAKTKSTFLQNEKYNFRDFSATLMNAI